jgi:hypothetical protein
VDDVHVNEFGLTNSQSFEGHEASNAAGFLLEELVAGVDVVPFAIE